MGVQQLGMQLNLGATNKMWFMQVQWQRMSITYYRQIFNVSGTKSQNLNLSRLVLQLLLPNPLKPGVE